MTSPTKPPSPFPPLAYDGEKRFFHRTDNMEKPWPSCLEANLGRFRPVEGNQTESLVCRKLRVWSKLISIDLKDVALTAVF